MKPQKAPAPKQAGRAPATLLQRTARALFTSLTLVSFASAEQSGVVRFGGLPIPGATVKATQGTRTLNAITDGNGAYRFPETTGAWTVEVGMQLFGLQKKEIADATNAEWDLDLLPPEEITKVSVVAPVEPPAAPAAAAVKPTAAAAKQTATNTRGAFQRTQLNGNAAATPPPAEAPPQQDAEELRQRAADGLQVNGSVNNGAASPFAQLGAFGNNRRGQRSLYNGNIGANLANSLFDARNYSLSGQDTPKPGYNRFQGLASFGGPIRIPKLMARAAGNFTVNYQWTHNSNGRVLTGLMPTEDQRRGILADRVIAPALIAPQARALLALYPLPNFTGNTRYNYQIPVVGGQHADELQARANRGFGRKDQVQGDVGWQNTRSDNTSLFGFLNTNRINGINANTAWRHQFTPRFFTNIRAEYSRQSNRILPFFANQRNVSGEAGIGGNLQDPINWGPPALSFAGGISGIGDSQATFNRNQTAGVRLDTFWSHGRHSVTGGGGIRRQQSNVLSQQDPRGSFTFTGVNSGSDFGNFLLGLPDASSIAYGNADKYFRATNGEMWVSDDWRVNPNLTLNVGLRWEYWGAGSELYGRLVNLDISPDYRNATPVVSGNPLHPDRNNLAPRIAFSWRPIAASSMVVRGNYGVYYDTSVYFPILSQMAQQAPLSVSTRSETSLANPLTLANGFRTAIGITPTNFAVDPSFRLGYAQIWQTSVQRDLPKALQMTVVYSGTKGTRLQQQTLPNSYPVGGINPCPLCVSGYTLLSSNGNSIRNALQIQVRRRLRAGFQGEASYTYARNFDNAIIGNAGIGLNRGYIAQNWLDLRAERGRSNFDQRNLLTLTGQYTTSQGLRGAAFNNNWKGTALRDWTLGLTASLGSGLPQTPTYLAATRGTGVTGTLRPDATGQDVQAAPNGLHLNPAAYSIPKPGAFGNAARNSITGPNQFTLNASMGRSFQVTDRVSFDFRLEGNNILNRVNYSSWVTTVNNTQFGLPAAVNAMRTFQTTMRARF